LAKYIATTDGNWSTVGTWSTGTNTPTNHASTRITIDSAKYTDTFTAPSTSDDCLGVIINISALATSGYSYVVTLQENGSDTAATKTIAIADLALGAYFVKFTTPYTFTSTTAGYYRFKIDRSGTGAGTLTTVSNSAGTLVAFQAVDDRTPAAAPTTGDDVWVVGANESGTVSVIVDGTQLVGSGTDTTRSQYYMNQACYIGRGGLLTWDTSASATLTCKGHIYVIGKSTHKAELRIGTSSVAYPTAYTAKLRFDCYGTNYRASLGSSNGGRIQLHGAAKTYYKTKFASGAGTVADPMVVADAVDWTNGDEIVIGSTSQAVQYAVGTEPEDEHMVITKVDASTYSLVSVNKLFNAGFEGASFASWTQSAGTGAIAIETSAVNSGAKAAKLTSGATSNTYIYQDITVKAGVSTTLSFYTRGDGTYAGQYKIVRQNTTTADIVALKSTGVTGTTYTQVSETFTTPVGCTTVRIYLYCPATNAGVAYFDDVSTTYTGLMYTHTTSAVVLNLTRNVVLESTTDTEYMWDGTSNYPLSATNIQGDIDWDWMRMNTGGGAVVGEYTIYGDYFQCDYSVFWNWVGGSYGPISYTHNSTFVPKLETLTGLIVYRSQMTASFKCDTFNKTLVDCFAIRCSGPGFWFTNGGTLRGCKAISCNYASNSAYAAFYLAGSGFELTDCETQTAGKASISFAGGVQGTFTRFKSFTDGIAISFYPGNFVTPQYADIDWIDCEFGYEILSNGDNLASAPLAAEWRFTNYQNVDNVDFAITPTGYRYRTGTGLTDTTVHTAGGYAVRFQPTSSTSPLLWTYKVSTGNTQTYETTISIWVKINNAAYYAGTHQNPKLTVNYDNGTLLTATATDTTDWQKLSIPYTAATTYGVVTVTIDGYTDATTTNAYFYVDDMELAYPSGYAVNLGKFDVWALGNPITPSSDTTGILSYDWTQDPYVVHTEAQANALTGIALNYTLKTITVTESHSLTELYEYCKASARTLGVIQALSTKDGITYKLSGGWTLVQGANVDITGTPFLDLNGTVLAFPTDGSMIPTLRNGSITLGTAGTIVCNMTGISIDYQAAGTFNHAGSTTSGTITLDTTTESTVVAQFTPGTTVNNLDEVNITVESAATVDITVNNIVAGSRIQIYNTDDSVEMYNEIVAGTSFTDSITYSEDVNVRIRLMYVDGLNAYKWYTATATIG